MPHYPPGAEGGGLDLILNEINARRMGNLTFGLIKSLCHLIVSRNIVAIEGDLITWLSQTVGHLKFCLVKSLPHCPRENGGAYN